MEKLIKIITYFIKKLDQPVDLSKILILGLAVAVILDKTNKDNCGEEECSSEEDYQVLCFTG